MRRPDVVPAYLVPLGEQFLLERKVLSDGLHYEVRRGHGSVATVEEASKRGQQCPAYLGLKVRLAITVAVNSSPPFGSSLNFFFATLLKKIFFNMLKN